jgi:hypothetical protein
VYVRGGVYLGGIYDISLHLVHQGTHNRLHAIGSPHGLYGSSHLLVGVAGLDHSGGNLGSLVGSINAVCLGTSDDGEGVTSGGLSLSLYCRHNESVGSDGNVTIHLAAEIALDGVAGIQEAL